MNLNKIKIYIMETKRIITKEIDFIWITYQY